MQKKFPNLPGGNGEHRSAKPRIKAGTKEKQRIVAIQPNGPGSHFQLVYVEARGDDKEKKAN